MNKKNEGFKQFLEYIENKKLYCYGAGKIFKDFICSYPAVDVYAVIDRNNEINILQFDDKKVPVISIGKFISEYDDDSVLLITCLDYREVEEELNGYSQLDSLPCYVYCKMNTSYDDECKNISGKYQIIEFRLQDYNAGNKAPSDVATIAAKVGYKALSFVRGTLRNGKFQTQSEWNRIYGEIVDNSTIFIQLPMVDISGGIYKLIELRREKNIKIICIVHDIEILRRKITDEWVEQYNMLRMCADVWIVHNIKMKEMLVSKGFDESRIVCLGIFDYLIDDSFEIKQDAGIVVAGNLLKEKSEYIYKLNMLKNVKFNLFGANYSGNNYENISYFGTFLPDELIKNMQGKYGLVWDGDSLDTCSGLTGEYLKVNNPHKLSLYLAVGLPVIIWSEAAEAEFVVNENVGLTVSSLYELSDKLTSISDEEYAIMKGNAIKVGKRLRNGEYLTKALKCAEEILQNK